MHDCCMSHHSPFVTLQLKIKFIYRPVSIILLYCRENWLQQKLNIFEGPDARPYFRLMHFSVKHGGKGDVMRHV
jgi:hypothetical protein